MNRPGPSTVEQKLKLFSLAAAAIAAVILYAARPSPPSAALLFAAFAAFELIRFLYTRRLLRPLEHLARQSQQIAAQVEHAEAASRLKSQFVANMSHEIRTPMNGILGMAQVLLRSELTERQRKQTQTMCDSAEALLTILDDILDFSKIEARKLDLEIVDFNLRDVVEGVADLMAVKAHQKGLELISFIEPDVPTALRGDPVRLRQILGNLSGNAIKFTTTGEVSIRVKRAPQTPNLIHFEIIDSGIGIPQSKRDLLFQPFSQLDASTTRRFGGTGLGLSIVRTLVEMMHGEVGVDSEEGKGSRFWFTAVLEQQPQVRRPNPLCLKQRRVLVVESNARSRGLLMELLAFWKADAVAATDAATALALLEDPAVPPFEVILIDLDLNGMRGDRLAASIQRLPHCAGIPMAVLATIETSDASLNWQALGFSWRLTKPIKQGELGNCLASLLGYGPPPSAAPVRSEPEKDREGRARLRLLLVEDSPVNQEVAIGILDILGFRADVAADAPSALRLLAEKPYDMILMDCQLPGMDGYQLTGHIRSASSNVLDHGVPIIAVTAHAMAGSREKCIEAGMNGFVTKPLRPAALESEIERLSTGRPLPPAPEPATLADPKPPAFDSEGLLDRLMGNEVLARRVVSRFLSDVPQQLAALSAALDQADPQAARLAAHTIKGAAANVGGEDMRELASRMEQSNASGDLTAALGMLPSLEHRFEHLKPELERFLASD
ncbi:MAG: response regulator [Acidobacteria bacterium]|nr:response regulator [Acidobacteriota bacterium]